ncbi:C2 calcium/lipid-binding domain-containing protein CaLB [Tanacetum coccineum]
MIGLIRFYSKDWRKDLESYESLENNSDDESDLGIPIQCIDSVNTPYSVEQRTARPDGVKKAGIDVDRAKIDVIAKLPYPSNVKGVRSFLYAKFDFSDDCKKAFNILKERLTTTPIIISPDWNVPFELMCDASDFAVGIVFALKDGKLKGEALKNKAIMEGIIEDKDNREYEMEHEDKERCELFDDHEGPVCNIRRFEMIKYSFGQDKEYFAVKENEYDDLTSTSEDACRTYQEIFHMMDKGWMVTRAG